MLPGSLLLPGSGRKFWAPSWVYLGILPLPTVAAVKVELPPKMIPPSGDWCASPHLVTYPLSTNPSSGFFYGHVFHIPNAMFDITKNLNHNPAFDPKQHGTSLRRLK